MNKFAKQISLYALCIFFPLIPYYYSKKFKHGIIIESIVFAITLFSFYEIMYAIGRYDTNLDLYFIGFPAIILGCAAFTITDSVYWLHKQILTERRKSN